MKIQPIQLNRYQHKNYINQSAVSDTNKQMVSEEYSKLPLGNIYGYNINFTSGNLSSKRRIADVPIVEFENYKSLSKTKKESLRKLYREFPEILDNSQKQAMLKIDYRPEFMQIPLQTEKEMDEFIKIAQVYSKYKEHPIICLGRSPKLFLNASLWMKDGIPEYKYVAFSGRWYRVYDGDYGDNRGLVRLNSSAPTKSEEKAYRKYLKSIEADPLSIVKKTQKTGKKAIITDYIDTGKGLTSFLDFMSRYAQDQKVLDEFGHSFDLVTVGNNEYRGARKLNANLSDPEVWMPELLEKYNQPTTAWGTGKVIEQTYYDMDYDVFKQTLINQNTNECRSTYYPCRAWNIYQPNKFKTGMFRDFSKIKELVKHLHSEKVIYNFDPVMSAYRNLLNFRILDALNQRNLLKTIRHTR